MLLEDNFDRKRDRQRLDDDRDDDVLDRNDDKSDETDDNDDNDAILNAEVVNVEPLSLIMISSNTVIVAVVSIVRYRIHRYCDATTGRCMDDSSAHRINDGRISIVLVCDMMMIFILYVIKKGFFALIIVWCLFVV